MHVFASKSTRPARTAPKARTSILQGHSSFNGGLAKIDRALTYVRYPHRCGHVSTSHSLRAVNDTGVEVAAKWWTCGSRVNESPIASGSTAVNV